MITQESFEVNPQKTIVRYNRQLGTWQTVNGKVNSFGPGSNNKRRALLYALRNDHWNLFELVIKFIEINGDKPELMDRLLKAASLVCKGLAYDNGRVRSQNNPDETYTVTFSNDGSYHCTCPDFEGGLQRRAGLDGLGGVDTHQGLHCKHTLAIELAYLAKIDLPGEPIPFQEPTPDPALSLSDKPIDF